MLNCITLLLLEVVSSFLQTHQNIFLTSSLKYLISPWRIYMSSISADVYFVKIYVRDKKLPHSILHLKNGRNMFHVTTRNFVKKKCFVLILKDKYYFFSNRDTNCNLSFTRIVITPGETLLKYEYYFPTQILLANCTNI